MAAFDAAAVHRQVRPHQAVVAEPFAANVAVYCASGAHRAHAAATTVRFHHDHLLGRYARAVLGGHVLRERLHVARVPAAHAAQRGPRVPVLLGHVLVQLAAVGQQAAAQLARVRHLSAVQRGVMRPVRRARGQPRETSAATGSGALQSHVVAVHVTHVLPQLRLAGVPSEALFAHLGGSATCSAVPG